MSSKVRRYRGRARRARRVRRRISGTAMRPRLTVYRSLKHVYAQLIDDATGQTLVTASSLDPELREKVHGCNRKTAREVGLSVAQKARAKGVEQVVFDRNGYLYHGVVQAVADGAREGELKL